MFAWRALERTSENDRRWRLVSPAAYLSFERGAGICLKSAVEQATKRGEMVPCCRALAPNKRVQAGFQGGLVHESDKLRSMHLGEYFREQHAFELERRYRIGSALAMPMGLLTLLVSRTYGLSLGTHQPWDLYEMGSILSALLMAPALISCVCQAWRVGVGREYCLPATAKKVSEHEQRLKKWLEECDRPQDDLAAEMESFLANEYMCCADYDATRNDERSASLLRLKQGVVVVFALFAIAGSVSLFGKMTGSMRSAEGEHVQLESE